MAHINGIGKAGGLNRETVKGQGGRAWLWTSVEMVIVVVVCSRRSKNSIISIRSSS